MKIFAVAVLAASDLLAFAIALSLSVAARVSIFPALSDTFNRPTYTLAHYFHLWWLPVVYLGALAYAGLYTRRVPYWEEVRRSLNGSTLWTILTFAVLSAAQAADDVSRPVVVLTWVLLVVVLPVTRGVTKQALFAAGPWRKRVLLLARGERAEALARALSRDRTLGYEVAGIVDNPEGLVELAVELRAHDVVLASADFGRAEFLGLVEQLRDVAENVLIAPDLSDVPVLGVDVLGLFEDRALLLRVPNNLLKPWNLALKRAFDLAVATVLGVLLAPVVALAAALVKLDSPGPAFHIQSRVGRKGKFFACYKLRTMHTDGPERLHAHFHANPDAIEEWRRFHKLRVDDPRVTRLGRWLRSFALDEIPQLYNVVRGEMSLVGPRPYLPSEIGLLPSAGMLDVRPGMTGLWQVSGKNALDFNERGRMERWYVSNWSLWLDLLVLVRTIPAILKGDRDTLFQVDRDAVRKADQDGLLDDQERYERGLSSAHFGHDVPETAAPLHNQLHNQRPVRG